MRAVVLTVPGEAAELAADRLWSAGARAVEERPLPGGDVELVTVLAHDDTRSEQRLGDLPRTWSMRFVDLVAEHAETWRDVARPVRIDADVVIRPAWQDPVGAPVEVAIEPGGSFGLGDHPTTIASAESMVGLVRGGQRVLDVGCGSGVLSILAVKLGADTAVAIDVADAALEATRANALRNGVAGRIEIGSRPLGEIDGDFDIVVANILAPTLIELAPELRRLTAGHGTLVVSGILAAAHDHVLDALAPMTVRRTRERDGWVAVELGHPRPSSS